MGHSRDQRAADERLGLAFDHARIGSVGMRWDVAARRDDAQMACEVQVSLPYELDFV